HRSRRQRGYDRGVHIGRELWTRPRNGTPPSRNGSARDELTAAVAAIKWPDPTSACLATYDRAYAHETAARERMNQAYERVRR
ncbi:hypothetical protein ACOTD9_11590, partial [Achromobacter xylosoxidans]